MFFNLFVIIKVIFRFLCLLRFRTQKREEEFDLLGPFKYQLASLIAQLVKNLPAMQETPVRFLGQEDLLKKG